MNLLLSRCFLHQVTAKRICVSPHKLLDCKCVIDILQIHVDMSLAGELPLSTRWSLQERRDRSSPCRRVGIPLTWESLLLVGGLCSRPPLSCPCSSRAVWSKHTAPPSSLWLSTTSTSHRLDIKLMRPGLLFQHIYGFILSHTLSWFVFYI